MFSKTTEYALRATIYIAQKSSEEKKIGIEEIAKAIDSPQSFTAKILQALTKDNRVISSARGPNGGFYITDRAKKLPVRVIMEVMGEDDFFKNCVLGLKLCSEVNPCPMHNEYKPIKQQLMNLFEKKTIQILADEIKNGDAFIRITGKKLPVLSKRKKN
ncbi:Rrf2 family transcriptional regulator [Hydrotalea sp.]|uniref:RrF2 family transcriptional regulator n=1 Tax=Hydrotalea sp. TaxID=2881279 RepID=UPI00260B308C|nr:Rrf2 family transcriptional regulator [Hydrotalea sp.]